MFVGLSASKTCQLLLTLLTRHIYNLTRLISQMNFISLMCAFLFRSSTLSVSVKIVYVLTNSVLIHFA